MKETLLHFFLCNTDQQPTLSNPPNNAMKDPIVYAIQDCFNFLPVFKPVQVDQGRGIFFYL